MKLIKKFESYSQNREEMCKYLCGVGYTEKELEVCSDEELKNMCNFQENDYSQSHNENHENQNYMFFSNLKTIKRLVDKMLEMDESEVDAILSNGHNWALDHITTSKDDVEEVFNFLAGYKVLNQ